MTTYCHEHEECDMEPCLYVEDEDYVVKGRPERQPKMRVNGRSVFLLRELGARQKRQKRVRYAGRGQRG